MYQSLTVLQIRTKNIFSAFWNSQNKNDWELTPDRPLDPLSEDPVKQKNSRTDPEYDEMEYPFSGTVRSGHPGLTQIGISEKLQAPFSQ